jgi:ketosteroid isomerase-like protein
MTDPEVLVRRYYDLVDAADVEGLLGLFSDTVVYERQGTARSTGKDALRRFYREGRIIASGAHTLGEVLVGKVWVAVRGAFRGVLKNGDAVDLEFTDWFHVENGVIERRQSLFPGRAV